MHARRPNLLTAQHAALAVVYQHDDRGIGAWKMLRAARSFRADPDMPAALALRRMTADTAKAVAPMPMHQAPGVGHDRALVAGHQRSNRAQVVELSETVQGRVFLRLFQMGKVERDVGPLFGHAEKDLRADFGKKRRHLFRAEPCRLGRLAGNHEVARTPDCDEPGCRIAQAGPKPDLVGSELVGPVETGSAIEVRRPHGGRESGIAGLERQLRGNCQEIAQAGKRSDTGKHPGMLRLARLQPSCRREFACVRACGIGTGAWSQEGPDTVLSGVLSARPSGE